MNWWSHKPPENLERTHVTHFSTALFFASYATHREQIPGTWHSVSVPVLTASLACRCLLLMIPSAAPLPEPASVSDGSSHKWLVNSVLVLVCDALCGTFHSSAGFILYFAELDEIRFVFPNDVPQQYDHSCYHLCTVAITVWDTLDFAQEFWSDIEIHWEHKISKEHKRVCYYLLVANGHSSTWYNVAATQSWWRKSKIPLYHLLMLIYPINYLAELTSEIFPHEIRDEQKKW